MIYPKFPRRTLALILFCLVVTLGAVGLIFLVYFFNKSSVFLMDSSVKTIYGDQKQNQEYRQNMIGFEQKFTNRYAKDVKGTINQVRIGNNRSYILQTYDEDIPISLSSSIQEFEPKHVKQELLRTKTMNSKPTKDSNSNLDTIYIDDFDRPAYNSKTKSELSSIEYFDTILVDHKNEKENRALSSLRLQEADSMRSIIYQNNFISDSSNINLKITKENERKSRINSKRRGNESHWNKTKLLRYVKVAQHSHEDDDIYDLEIDATGSGSGDFIDDNEIKTIFTKRNNKKMTLEENKPSKSEKKDYMKSSRSRKKHRNYFFNSKNEIISSPPLLATLSSEDDRSYNNWINKESSKKVSLHPTISSPGTKRVHSSLIKTSKIFSESLDRKWPDPALISNHKIPVINESDNNSATLPTPKYKNNIQSQLELEDLGSTAAARVIENSLTNVRELGASENNEAWIETRTRRIMGNVKKSEERSRQLLLCEEAGGGELCRMLFKGHIND